ncbi:MAG: hypothetical protein ACOC4B_03450 [Bacteroidota bacterium]
MLTKNSFKKIINLLRLEKSLELLKDPFNQIDFVGNQVGYFNRKTFRENFKKYFLVSPQDMKTTLIQSDEPDILIQKTINEAWLRTNNNFKIKRHKNQCICYKNFINGL